MRFALTVVEQLDRAATELAVDNPINNRLALILIDNAAELLIHRQCVGHVENHSVYSRLSKAHEAISLLKPEADESGFSEDIRQNLMTTGQLKGAKGNYFDPKLKVLKQMGDLSQSERRLFPSPTVTATSFTT